MVVGTFKSAMQISACALLLGAISTTPATAGSAEDETFQAFEWFCLKHIERTAEIEGLFRDLDLPPLPDEKARIFLAPVTGAAWFVPGNETDFIVAVTHSGSCSVYGPNALASKVGGLFERFVKHRLVKEYEEGSEVVRVYVVTASDTSKSEVHGMVLVRRSNLMTKGVSLTSKPESAMRAGGLELPIWP